MQAKENVEARGCRATFAGCLEERVVLRLCGRGGGFAGCIRGEKPSGSRHGHGQVRGGGIPRCGHAAAEGGGREPRHISGGAAAERERNQEWRRPRTRPLGEARKGRKWVPSLICAIIWASYLLGLISKWALRIIRANGLCMSWKA